MRHAVRNASADEAPVRKRERSVASDAVNGGKACGHDKEESPCFFGEEVCYRIEYGDGTVPQGGQFRPLSTWQENVPSCLNGSAGQKFDSAVMDERCGGMSIGEGFYQYDSVRKMSSNGIGRANEAAYYFLIDDKQGDTTFVIQSTGDGSDTIRRAVYDIEVEFDNDDVANLHAPAVSIDVLDDPVDAMHGSLRLTCSTPTRSEPCLKWRANFRWGGADGGDGLILRIPTPGMYCLNLKLAEAKGVHSIRSYGNVSSIALDRQNFIREGIRICPRGCRSPPGSGGGQEGLSGSTKPDNNPRIDGENPFNADKRSQDSKGNIPVSSGDSASTGGGDDDTPADSLIIGIVAALGVTVLLGVGYVLKARFWKGKKSSLNEENGWSQHMHQDGRMYWHNATTGETSWNTPTDVLNPASGSDAKLSWGDYSQYSISQVDGMGKSSGLHGYNTKYAPDFY